MNRFAASAWMGLLILWGCLGGYMLQSPPGTSLLESPVGTAVDLDWVQLARQTNSVFEQMLAERMTPAASTLVADLYQRETLLLQLGQLEAGLQSVIGRTRLLEPVQHWLVTGVAGGSTAVAEAIAVAYLEFLNGWVRTLLQESEQITLLRLESIAQERPRPPVLCIDAHGEALALGDWLKAAVAGDKQWRIQYLEMDLSSCEAYWVLRCQLDWMIAAQR